MTNLRVPQAAAYLGLSKSYLDKARMTPGAGPAYAKLGATVIYSTDDLDDWVRSNRIPANDNRGEVAA